MPVLSLISPSSPKQLEVWWPRNSKQVWLPRNSKPPDGPCLTPRCARRVAVSGVLRTRSAALPHSLRSRPWPELGTAKAQGVDPVRGLVGARHAARTSAQRRARSHPGPRGGQTRIRPPPREIPQDSHSPKHPSTTPRHSPACRIGPSDSLPCRRQGGSPLRCSHRTRRFIEVFRVTRRHHPRAAGVFPLRLRRERQPQTINPRIQCLQKLLSLIPAYQFHGTIWPFEVAGILPHHGFPEGLGARRVKHPEARLDRYQVLRSSVLKSLLFIRRSHPENPRRYPAEPLHDVQHPQGTPGTIQPILAPFRCPDRGDAVWRGCVQSCGRRRSDDTQIPWIETAGERSPSRSHQATSTPVVEEHSPSPETTDRRPVCSGGSHPAPS